MRDPKTLFRRELDHGRTEVDHDPDEPEGLYIQSAAHAAQGFAFLPRDEVVALRDALDLWLIGGGVADA